MNNSFILFDCISIQPNSLLASISSNVLQIDSTGSQEFKKAISLYLTEVFVECRSGEGSLLVTHPFVTIANYYSMDSHFYFIHFEIQLKNTFTEFLIEELDLDWVLD